MSSFGVLAEGFRAKTVQIIIDEMEQALREAFGPEINTQADSALGQIVRIFADKAAEEWEVQNAVYGGWYPDSAGGAQLDNVGSITGAVRLAATKSQVLLSLSLDDGTTLTVGRIISVGTNGARFVTTAEIANSSGVQATLQVAAEADVTGAVVANEGTLDTIVTPVSGWSDKAALTCFNGETYPLVDGQTLLIDVDGVGAQTVTFNTGDFTDIANATAAEVASAILLDITTGLEAVDEGGFVRIRSSTSGPGSSVQVTGGTGNPALGFEHERIRGFNPSRSAKILSGTSETYDLDDADTLFVRVDGGGTQTVIFNTGDFVDIDNATAIEVATVINDDLAGALAYVSGGKVQIESLTSGVNSLIEVTGGSANVDLTFVEGDPQGGTAGDAVVGRELETDPEFRLRREDLLRIAGSATVEAIRSAVRALVGVIQAFVFENTSTIVDGEGRPPKSFEVVVQGGDDDDIGEEIFAVKPAGIETFKVPGPNGVTVSVTDSQGISHDVNFSRPDTLRMFIEIDITIDGNFGGGDSVAGLQQVKEALKDFGDTLLIGEDIIINQFEAAVLESSGGVTGVVDTPTTRIEDSFPPTNTANIVIASRELATFSTADIVVNIV